jgi:hypothetical protein
LLRGRDLCVAVALGVFLPVLVDVCEHAGVDDDFGWFFASAAGAR